MRILVLAVLAALAAACGEQPKDPIAKLEDPSTCKECHNAHYTQWAGSMHAYASDDPVFLAMNKRGQRDTNGALGTFCLQCHAPMAVALGIVTPDNAADFDPNALPPTARGITCYFCHDVKQVQADHNNGLVVALDDDMRGGVHDPTDSPAHHSSYDKMMDGYTNQSVECGSCHDVVTPRGVALERTYAEWQQSVFSHDDPAHHLPVTCSGCHMMSDPSTSVIADKPGLNVKSRPNSFHRHDFAAIDQATTTFPADDPQTAAQLAQDQAMQVKAILDPALTIIGPTPVAGGIAPGGVCLDPPGVLSVRMDTINVGHMYPSGAGQDRRSWLEVIAYDASNKVVWSSGVVPDGMDPDDISDDHVSCSSSAPMSCSGFWDRTVKDDGTPAHFFWDVATETSHLLKPGVTNDPNSPLFDHSTTAEWNLDTTTYSEIDHITARIRTRPFSYAELDDLVASGDLDPSIPAKLVTLDSAGATVIWTKATAGMGLGSKNTNCNPNPPL